MGGRGEGCWFCSRHDAGKKRCEMQRTDARDGLVSNVAELSWWVDFLLGQNSCVDVFVLILITCFVLLWAFLSFVIFVICQFCQVLIALWLMFWTNLACFGSIPVIVPSATFQVGFCFWVLASFNVIYSGKRHIYHNLQQIKRQSHRLRPRCEGKLKARTFTSDASNPWTYLCMS